MTRARPKAQLRHPVNVELDGNETRVERAVDAFVAYFGSLKFIAWMTALIIAWVVFNTLTLTNAIHFDKYPFILLNLLFSTQASYAAPLILLSQNRAAERDRLEAEHDYKVNEAALLATRQDRDLDRETRDLVADMHRLLVGHIDLKESDCHE